MKLDAVKFGIAWAVAAAAAWLVCALLVFSMPGPSMMMSRQMMHSDMGQWSWSFSPVGMLGGTILWALLAGFFGWFVAVIYNALNKSATGTEN